MKIRLLMLVLAGLALAACNTTNSDPRGDKAGTQLGPNHPRGL